MITKHFKSVLAVCLSVALMLPAVLPLQPKAVHAEPIAAANAYTDKLVFGHSKSEQQHHFKGEFTSAIVGALGEPARVSLPRTPEEIQGGELTFTMWLVLLPKSKMRCHAFPPFQFTQVATVTASDVDRACAEGSVTELVSFRSIA